MRNGIKALNIAAAIATTTTVAAEPAVTKSNKDAIRAEIKQRCQDSMGEYGDQMVLQCMKQDWQAAQKIPKYRQNHPDVTSRCLDQMRDYGFAMVVQCIKQDAGAKNEIENW